MSVWSHIEKNEAYQSLDDAGKAKIRREYFNEFMVPDPDFAKLPEPERDRVYMEFVNQGQQPLEQVPKTPITDFVSAQDQLAGQAVSAIPPEAGLIGNPEIQPGGQIAGVMEKIGMPTTTPAAGPAPIPLAPEPFRLPDINIPESVEPVLDVDPNTLRPYEKRAGENLVRDLLKIIGATSGGVGYLAGATEIGPQTKGMSLEQRSAEGEKMMARAAEPFMKAERAIAPKRELSQAERLENFKTGKLPKGYDQATGKIIEPTGMDVASEALMKAGDAAGAKVLKETNNPYLAAAAATTIQAAPILLPLIGRRVPGIFRRLKASTPYRQMAIKERGLVLQTLEETMAKNPNMTEGELARMYPQFFEEAKAKRTTGEQPVTEKPRATPEETINGAVPGHEFKYEGYRAEGYVPQGHTFHAEKPGSPIEGTSITVPDLKPETIKKAVDRRVEMYKKPAPKTEEVAPETSTPAEISDFYIRKNDLQEGLEKLNTLKKRYEEEGISGEIPKVDKAIAAIEDVIKAPAASQAPPEVPAEAAAPEPARVPPFPEQKPALPAPSPPPKVTPVEESPKEKPVELAPETKKPEVVEPEEEIKTPEVVEPKPPEKISDYEHLKDVEVSVKGIRGKTGDKITVRMNAKEALEKIDSDIENLNKIMECLET